MRFLSRIKVNADILTDLLGVIAIFALFILGLWVAYGIGLPTVGGELIGPLRAK